MIPLQPKHIALAPVYLYQGLKLKRTALRLPEAQGERHGRLLLSDAHLNDANILSLMLLGDSSAAGVGVESQQEALAGHLLGHLQQTPEITAQFNQIDWALHATSGHTSFDALRRLYVLPTPQRPVDVMVVLIGVNDTTSNVSVSQWQAQLHQIIELGKRKFGAKYILFACLPPMQNMPAIPSPLNKLLGSKSQLMNDKLIEVCESYQQVYALPIEFANTGLSDADLFAEDGFHPNSQAYSFLALKIAKNITKLMVSSGIDTPK